MHGEAVARAGAELIRLARQVGLVRGEWVAIDGSKFRAVASASTIRERETQENGPVCGIGRRLLPVSAKTAMHDGRSTLPQTPPARECAAAHESARNGRNDAVAAMHG